MAKPILDKARAEQSLAEPKTDSNVKFELSKELLTELRNNAYSRRVEEDVVDHIAKILEILDLIKIDNVDPFQIRMKVFHLSLVGDARKCNYDKMCDDDEEGRDSLKFVTWINSNFKDHKKVDETAKHALLHSWIEVGKDEGIMDDIVLNDDEREESDYENPLNTNDDSFLEPYLDAHNKNAKRNEHNPMKCNGNTSELEKAPHSNNMNDAQPNGRMCRTEKFKVIKYSLGPNEEKQRYNT
ncbi:hypothetical protein Tco_1173443 [Tanacetum coccineum]